MEFFRGFSVLKSSAVASRSICSRMKLLRAQILACMLLLSLAVASASWKHAEKRRHRSGLLLQKPVRVSSRSSAGSLLSWPNGTEAFKELHAGAALLELNGDGMTMPMYTSVNTLCYVIEGRVQAGLVKPDGGTTNVRYIRVGDVLTVPSGWVFWLWNDGRLKMKAFCVFNAKTGGEVRLYRPFFLAGEGVLHGFSTGVLASMWEMNEADVEAILRSQNDTGFIHAESSATEAKFTERLQQDEEAGDFVFNMDTARPDLVSEAGSLTMLGDSRMPILEKLQLGALKVRLNAMSMFAPQWSRSRGQIIHVTKGHGRVEVSSHEGEQLLAERVEEGDLFVVPPMHPHVMVNDRNSGAMEWICVHLSSKFKPSFMAASPSVFNNVPVEVLAAVFNVRVELAEALQAGREHDTVMFKVDAPRSTIV